jgi:phosphatidylinositol glycan class B
LCGLAFECRYQTALMGLGLFAWLAVIARARVPALAAFIGGGLVALLLGALADRWGYGVWVFPPLDYVNVNIVQGVAARSFGREPVFAYLYLLPATGFFAITLIVMAAMAAMWLRNPRHAVTWMTLPFVALHVAVAHKEARFLFPLVILATSFPVLGFSPDLPRWRGAFARIWSWRAGWTAKVTTATSLFFMAYLALYPFGVRPHMPMSRYLYRNITGPVYTIGTSFPDYPMYRHARLVPVTAPEALADGSLLLTDTPTPPPLPPGVKATLLYSEFPFARFGYGRAGSDFIGAYTRFAARARFLKLLPLHWYTLYRLERSARMRS